MAESPIYMNIYSSIDNISNSRIYHIMSYVNRDFVFWMETILAFSADIVLSLLSSTLPSEAATL